MNMSEQELQDVLAKNKAVKIAVEQPAEITSIPKPATPLHDRLKELEREALALRALPPVPGSKRQRKIADPDNPYEDVEHEAVADWLTLAGVEFHHSPNGGMRPQKTKNGVPYSREAQKLKRLGTKAGFPDILIIDKPPRYPEAPGAVVEMKRRKGGTVSAEQKEMLGKFAVRGWRTFVANGADQAIAWLKEQGYGRGKC